MSTNFNVEWESASCLPVVGPFFEGELTPTILGELYSLLQYPFSREAIQTASKTITKKGYDTTGVGYQFLVNRMNEVLGPSHWRYLQEILKEIPGKWGNDPNITLAVETTVQIGNYDGGAFVPIHEVKGIGGHTGKDWPDTLKGAQSNSLKKALGFLGVGREAYEGTLDDDNKSDLEKNKQGQSGNSANNGSRNTNSRPNQGNRPANAGNTNQPPKTNFEPVQIPSGNPANSGHANPPRNNAATGNQGNRGNQQAITSIYSGQIVLTSDPVMKNGKASVMGVLIEEDIEVEICGWERDGMVEEVMSFAGGQVLDIQGAQRRETERFGVQISLKRGQFAVAA